MHAWTLHRRSLTHYWRSHAAVLLGVVVGTAVLTGALVVGDSMRGSLRAAALQHLGGVDHAVRGTGFFRAELADELAASPEFAGSFAPPRPVILERGSATHADSHATVHNVSILGVDARYWEPGGSSPKPLAPQSTRTVVLNQPLADELHAQPGDEILLRLGKAAAISPELLLGRRDDTTLTLRLTVDRVVPAAGRGAFAVDPRQTVPRNAFVPLETLQRALGQRGRVNTLLISAHDPTEQDAAGAGLPGFVQRAAALSDLGLRLRTSEELGYVALESAAFVLAPPVESAGRAAAATVGAEAVGVLAYLANEIAVETRPEAVIPYSTVAAIGVSPALFTAFQLGDCGSPTELVPGEILLNEWAAHDVTARIGDVIQLTYYSSGGFGQLNTSSASFRLRAIVRLTGAAADPGFAPEYPGVTDATHLADWDPPFPIDLKLIRDKDEAYWDEHRATPKAFVSLADGIRLWADQPQRFGRITSLRVYAAEGQSLAATRDAFARELRQKLDVSQLGLRVDPLRERALAGATGSTDFAGLFIGFSFFLIVAAALLVALLFRLGVERRSREVGLLLATGFRPRQVAGLFMREALVITVLGTLGGLLAARAYAWLMLAGLRSWWAEAVNAPFLHLHATPGSYVIGFVASVLIALVSIGWSLRGLARVSPRLLLAGVTESPPRTRTERSHQSTVSLVVALLLAALALAALALSLLTDWLPQTSGFFVGGTALLLAALTGLHSWLRRDPHVSAHLTGPAALLRLGVRNARRHRGRSLLTAGLIAVATFNITALQALRLKTDTDVHTRDSGTGGFTLMAETAVPLPYDLNTAAGRGALGLSAESEPLLAGASFIPCRLRPGDETSCLNLYRPTEPRLLGAGVALITRGGFTFSAMMDHIGADEANPWTALHAALPEGVIPAIADEAAALWQLHLRLGDDLTITDERGADVRLRLVAFLKGSILQGEVMIAESHFVRLFPSISGHSFYLIDTPAERAAECEQTLERELTDFGLAVTPTSQRLTDLYAVQNTYLSTFQTLGGLGVLLGTVGLMAVLLRNVWERRGELALMRTLGFSRRALGGLVLVENAFLVGTGLLAGLVCAAVVVAPHVVQRALPVPWGSLLAMFGGIFVVGLLAGAAALIPTLRAPLLPALRSE